MHPITTMLWRHTAKSYDVGGYRVPQGWVTMICLAISHYSSQVFTESHKLRPRTLLARAGRGHQNTVRPREFRGRPSQMSGPQLRPQ